MTYKHTTANIICDSINLAGDRLTTFILTYPRYIHAEFMTHRMFARNAQSTRAIPTSKRISRVRTNPVYPIRWDKNQKGMVAKNEHVDNPQKCCEMWEYASRVCADVSEGLEIQGLHKQWAGRLLEPFDTITVICTATDYENFFALRCAPDAQPEINDLAWKMAHSYYNTTPRSLPFGSWHLPFIEGDRAHAILEYAAKHGYKWGDSILDLQLQVSAACCARVSYLNHDGQTIDIEKDIALCQSLINSGHMTPLEHQARPDQEPGREYCGPFRGWEQYRKAFHATSSVENRRFDYTTACLDQGRVP